MDHIAYDMEHASQQGLMRNVSKLLLFFTETCTLPRKSVEPQQNSTHSVMVDLSLHRHLQQDDTVKEADAAMRSFIMHRFLRAAEEVAAEHESSISFSKGKNLSKSSSLSLPQQSSRTPITNCTKSRPQQAPKCFTNSPHQKDIMPCSMSRFFCLGPKTLLFHAYHTVDAAFEHSNVRKKSWLPPPSYHMKVAKEGISLVRSENEGQVAWRIKVMGETTEHRSAIDKDVPDSHPLSPECANVEENHLRPGFSRSGYPGSDGCTNTGCNPPSSQSPQANLAANQFDKMKSKQSPHDDYGWGRKFATTALNEQGVEIVQKGMTPCNRKEICDCKSAGLCDHAENLPPHDLAGENISANTFRGYMAGLDTNGSKPIHEGGNRDEDDKLQFCDALSRLNSIKSNAPFHTFGSSKSESCEVLGFEGKRINNELDVTKASSHFETSHGSMSEMPLHIWTTNEKDTSVKMSSLSLSIDKNLKLASEGGLAKLRCKHDAGAYEENHECRQAELETKSFSRLRHGSLDSISGLYLSKASANFPMFPAKCQYNTPNALGWPFGIFNNNSSRVEGSFNNKQQEKNSIDKLAVGEKAPCPPLPPTPTDSWLGHAVSKNASKTSLLATLQQKEKVALPRRKLNSQSVDLDAESKLDFRLEGRWEDVVKGSRVHSGHLRYSKELQILMRTSL